MFVENGHIARARLLISQGRIKDAEKQIGYVLQEDPEDVEAIALLAECKVDRKQFGEAEELLKKTIGLKPYHDRPYYLFAFVQYQQNKLAAAKESLNAGLQINPWNAAYFGLYAYILIEERNYQEALNKANEGLAVDAQELTCLNARSQALFRLKQKDEAYETIKEALAINPEDDFTHTNFAWHFLEKGKHKEARMHFREALRINPGNNRARIGYKETLKANLPIYRWLLMFSLWLSSKSKQTRIITVIAIWLMVRVLSGGSVAAGWSVLGYSIIGVYLLFVLFSWIGNPVANLVLFCSREGKYVLSKTEKYAAFSVGISILAALVVFIFGGLLPGVNDSENYVSALIFLSIALPLSRIEYPIVLRNKSFLHWYTLLLSFCGLIAGVFILFGGEPAMSFSIVYLIAFAVYTWVFSFSNF